MTYNVLDVCARIRADAAPAKGKKCPGGYSIPLNKKCRTLGSPEGGGKKKGRRGAIATSVAVPTGVAAGLGATAIALGAAWKKGKKSKAGGKEAGTAPGSGAIVPGGKGEIVPGGGGGISKGSSGGASRKGLPGSGSQKAGGRKTQKPRSEEPSAPKGGEDWKKEFDFDPESRSGVKRARKQAAKKYHPDRPGGDTKKMQEINAELDRLEARATKDSRFDSMFVDMYPRWDMEHGCFYY